MIAILNMMHQNWQVSRDSKRSTLSKNFVEIRENFIDRKNKLVNFSS